VTGDVLIRLEGVSKKFCRELRKSLWYGVTDTVRDLLGRDGSSCGLRADEFWALDDVSFEVRRGQCLGLIGRNGAGKSTLLKLLNGLIKPDRGRIEIRGRVGALIALGAGFNPILTGRENIYVNGSVLGLTRKDIDQKLDDIIEFAEIGEFIDAPVQSYSSGMQMRLGFAVATAQQPDIVLLDEVLAVGDARFRQKCYARIAGITENAAVVFVSHSMEQVGHLCANSVILDQGRLALFAPTTDCIRLYNRLNTSTPTSESFLSVDQRLQSVTILISDMVNFGATITVTINAQIVQPLKECRIRVVFFDERGTMVAEWDSAMNGAGYRFDHTFIDETLAIGPVFLKPGQYWVSVQLHCANVLSIPLWSHKQHTVAVLGPAGGFAPYQLPSAPRVG
jgi:lipopolysaccharide transport system ATP-binding protein